MKKRTFCYLLALSLCAGIMTPVTTHAADVTLSNEEQQVIEAQSVKKKVNTVITTDGEIDDMNSFLRWLLYSNEMNIEGIVLSASCWHYAGGTVKMPDGTDGETYNSYRWLGNRWLPLFLEEYEKVYDNLIVHEPDMPAPEYLQSIFAIGNIKYYGEMDEITEGSELIKDRILSNPDGEDLVLQVWGGANTVCRALKSIEEEYKDTDDWERIYNKISNEVFLWMITDQDRSSSTSGTGINGYIKPNWPEIRYTLTNNLANPIGYGRVINDETPWYQKEWTDKIQNIGSSLLQHHVADGGGWDYRNASLSENGITNPEHKFYTVPDEPNVNNYPYDTWGETENRGKVDNEDAWTYQYIGEGDNPAWFALIDNGLRGGIEHMEWGNWAGRMKTVDGIQYLDTAEYVSESAVDGNPSAIGKESVMSAQRWIEDIQYDYAARAQWTVQSNYEDANHAPKSGVMNGLDLTVSPGEEITLNGVAYDPDGDNLSYSWYRYAEADTYGGTGTNKGTFKLSSEKDCTYTVPTDAKAGDTIHLIFETSDKEDNPDMTSMKAYKRVVLTVGENTDTALNISTKAHNVKVGDYFNVDASFKETKNSNTVVLNYSFDSAKFEYANYTVPKGGNISVIDTQYGDGYAKITLMIPDYEAEDLGSIMLHAKEDAILSNEQQTITVNSDYVVKNEDGNKVVESVTATTNFTTIGTGTPEPALLGDTNGDGVVDLIDLSNMIDWFGVDSSDTEWLNKYTYFDFNNNSTIDIYDISSVARLIE